MLPIRDTCISNFKGKNQYKLLHETSAAARSNKETLTVCILEQFGANLDMFGLDKPSQVLCYGCSLTLEKIDKKNKEVQLLKEKVLEHFICESSQLSAAEHCTPVHQPQGSQVPSVFPVSAIVDNPQPCTPIYSTLESNQRSTPGRPQPQGRQSSTLISALRDSEGINPSISEDTQQEARSTVNAENASNRLYQPHPKRHKVAVSFVSWCNV